MTLAERLYDAINSADYYESTDREYSVEQAKYDIKHNAEAVIEYLLDIIDELSE